MSTGLPRYLRVLRDRLRTATNALDTFERLEVAAAWGAPASDAKRQSAMRTIEQCVIDAADAIGCQPSEKWMFSEIIRRLREENQRLSEANATLAAQHLTEAKSNDGR